jgi:hypothetical protein
MVFVQNMPVDPMNRNAQFEPVAYWSAAVAPRERIAYLTSLYRCLSAPRSVQFAFGCEELT